MRALEKGFGSEPGNGAALWERGWGRVVASFPQKSGRNGEKKRSLKKRNSPSFSCEVFLFFFPRFFWGGRESLRRGAGEKGLGFLFSVLFLLHLGTERVWGFAVVVPGRRFGGFKLKSRVFPLFIPKSLPGRFGEGLEERPLSVPGTADIPGLRLSQEYSWFKTVPETPNIPGLRLSREMRTFPISGCPRNWEHSRFKTVPELGAFPV